MIAPDHARGDIPILPKRVTLVPSDLKSRTREGVLMIARREANEAPDLLGSGLLEQVHEDLDLVFSSHDYTLTQQDGKLLITFSEVLHPNSRRFAEEIVRLSCILFEVADSTSGKKRPPRRVG